MDTLWEARAWVGMGIGVIPITYRSKRPAFDALKLVGAVSDDGRSTWEPYKSRLPSAHELWQWFGGPKRNLGIVTGWQDLVVIDFDTVSSYEMWAAWAKGAGRYVETYRVLTGRGVHLYLYVKEKVSPFAVGCIDIKAAGGYVLAPPSVHPTGRRYVGDGGEIATVAALADVFPFEPAPYIPPAHVGATYSDPWEAATHATPGAGADIETIKDRVPLSAILPEISDRRAYGNKVLVHCPLHDDSHPSMLVFLEDQRCQCLAGCHGGRQLDVLDLYSVLHGVSVRDAMAALGRRL